MFREQDLIYLYDGSRKGFLCCVFESFLHRELPADVLPEEGFQPTLFPVREVFTDPGRARRVEHWMEETLTREEHRLFLWASFAKLEHKELHLLRFLQLCHLHGPRAAHLLQEPSVLAVNGAVTAIARESDHWMGFLRFEERAGVLIAQFEPDGFVLPLIRDHFCDRFSTERFLIFDRRHHAALISEFGKGRLIRLEDLELGGESEEEPHFKALFRRFYETIAIDARRNEKLRQNHMPKKFRTHMPEMQPPAAALKEEQKAPELP